ncbi:MAG: hypothetical protein N2561_09770 [Bacteroidetes bacterium]|nr:hypothetical protein [Rhodothermia bacterium]MCS7155218.1 hypothetical protein [Bacteroidota bacterium]MCX7907803.1 hypothetical protein [Bacteroidota bacterium]MDW8138622.1 hypothetical protein [Bacteroidota bacterium]MDW8284792.1 hypothetical protein [Bacteroidota bacterium]
MDRSQWIEGVGALVLLGLLTYGTLDRVGAAIRTQERERVTTAAVSLAQGLLEECSTRAFDERTRSGWCAQASALTPLHGLGPEAGEVYPDQFDDLDDFHGFLRLDSLGGIPYRIVASVYYADPQDLERPALEATFFKTLEVAVHSPHLEAPIRLRRTYAYYR